MTCGGSRLPAVNRAIPPRMRTRDTAKATKEARNSVTITAGTAISNVLVKYVPIPDSV
jgi:hypothetical protein